MYKSRSIATTRILAPPVAHAHDTRNQTSRSCRRTVKHKHANLPARTDGRQLWALYFKVVAWRKQKVPTHLPWSLRTCLGQAQMNGFDNFYLRHLSWLRTNWSQSVVRKQLRASTLTTMTTTFARPQKRKSKISTPAVRYPRHRKKNHSH